jgi:RNase adapter protein RapZ
VNKRKNIDLVIITGPSGAGRTTALDALEDLGFEAFDNLPLSLLPLLISGAQKNYPLALGIDLRNRDFSNNKLVEVINTINSDADFKCSLLYLDCSDHVLRRRYSETRRRHPLAPNKGAEIGIQKEKSLLASLSLNADSLINTSEMTPHDLKFQIEKLYRANNLKQAMNVHVHSFAYKRGVPKSVDMVIDCRFLRNPHWDLKLRKLTGQDSLVQSHIQLDPKFDVFIEKLDNLIDFLIPAYENEGKSYFNLSFGCTGGRHRSVFITELITETLAKQNIRVSKRHLELERLGLEIELN